MENISLEMTAALFRAADAPVIGTEGSKVVFATPAAVRALGSDPTGSRASAVLPERLTRLQSGLGAASFRLRGRDAVAILTGAGTLRIYTIRFAPAAPWTAPPTERQLNTLAEMRLAAEILRGDASLSPERSAQAGCLLLGCYRLQRWFHNMNTVSALREGTLPFQPTELNCAALLRDLAEQIRPLAARREIELALSVPETEESAAVDPVLLERLLLNLLSNSLLHCAAGGRIRLGMAQTETELTLTVQDTGSGIPPEKMGTLFTDHSPRTDFGRAGAACGLAAVLGIARLHGGELLLDTTPGVGTTVMVTLPRRQNPKLTLRAGAADYSTADRTTVLTELSDALEAEELL